jgi:hypothetical protein
MRVNYHDMMDDRHSRPSRELVSRFVNAFYENDVSLFKEIHQSGKVKFWDTGISIEDRWRHLIKNECIELIEYLSEYQDLLCCSFIEDILPPVGSKMDEYLVKSSKCWTSNGWSGPSEREKFLKAREKNIITSLRDELKDLKEKVEMLWIAPGMPGTFEARDHFYSLTEEDDG